MFSLDNPIHFYRFHNHQWANDSPKYVACHDLPLSVQILQDIPTWLSPPQDSNLKAVNSYLLPAQYPFPSSPFLTIPRFSWGIHLSHIAQEPGGFCQGPGRKQKAESAKTLKSVWATSQRDFSQGQGSQQRHKVFTTPVLRGEGRKWCYCSLVRGGCVGHLTEAVATVEHSHY